MTGVQETLSQATHSIGWLHWRLGQQVSNSKCDMLNDRVCNARHKVSQTRSACSIQLDELEGSSGLSSIHAQIFRLLLKISVEKAILMSL